MVYICRIIKYTMFKYWGFGLHIESEIEFPELLPFDFSEADITISLGHVPAELSGDDVVHKTYMSASPSEYLLNMINVARYYAANGKRIVIEPYTDADIPSIRLFMLSNAMAAILHQQNKIPFHASGIITDKGLVLFTGRSGAGKSTTACGLMDLGYKLFTDDVCVLSLNNQSGKIEAVPSYPMMKLWENTIDQIASGKSKSHKLRPHLPKYGFFEHGNFTTESLPIHQVFILNPDALAKEFTSRQLNALRSFKELQHNTYRRLQVDIMKLREHHFHLISRLTQQAEVIEVLRPQNNEEIASFITYIQHLIDAKASA